MIGLDRMGGNLAQHMLMGGHQMVAYDPVKEAVEAKLIIGFNKSKLEKLLSK